MKTKFFLTAVCLGIIYCATATEYKSYEEAGDRFYSQKNYLDAAEKFWQAAIRNSPTAIDKLSKNYNRWARAVTYDWGLAHKYLQTAADLEYKRKGNIPQKYEGRFFIIASENAIIERFGVTVIRQKYFWGGNKRCSYALENLYQKYYIKRDGEKIPLRSRQIDGLGDVAIVNKESAEKYFHFTASDRPSVDWIVYVVSPTDNKTLFPFNRFHKFVYESKMADFISICNKLGAKETKVVYLQKNNTNLKIKADVSLDAQAVKNYTAAKVAIQSGKIENAKIDMKFEGSTIIENPKSPWFSREPTWMSMKEARRNRLNPLKEYTAEFSYNDSFQVDITTKTAFAAAGFKIGMNTETKFENFQSIKWMFQVTFHPAKIIFP